MRKYRKNLFWVTTKDGDENWFVIARLKKTAESFFERFEGYGRSSAKAKLVCKIEKEYKKEKAYHAQLDMLKDLGFEVVSSGSIRVVRKNGKIFREGTVPQTVMFDISDEKGAGVYIIRISGTSKYKIGIATHFRSRFKNLQTGSADELEPFYFYPTPNYKRLEKYLHSKYHKNRLGREWFTFTFTEMCKLHDDICKFLKLPPKRIRIKHLSELQI